LFEFSSWLLLETKVGISALGLSIYKRENSVENL